MNENVCSLEGKVGKKGENKRGESEGGIHTIQQDLLLVQISELVCLDQGYNR